MISGPLPPKPRWGIVGPGEIARVFVRALAKYDLGSIEVVYGRCSDRRGAFCREFGGRPMETLEGLLQPGVVDVVYVSTPHTAHSEAVEGALERGIAVLCEKPMTVDPAETSRLIDLAQARSALLVEGWMYRFHPQIEALAGLLRDRMIGEVHQVVASFGVSCADRLPERILSRAMGGGSILDIGGYPASSALLVDRMLGGDGCLAHLGVASKVRTGLDVELDSEAELRFGSGLQAKLQCSFHRDLGFGLRIDGTEGSLVLPSAFLPEGRRDGRQGAIEVIRPDGSCTRKAVPAKMCCFGLQAQAVAGAWESGQVAMEFPKVDHQESRALAHLLDVWKSTPASA
ncbi:MAG: Gfo/Idh/MocA family oxidoreductase [Planctomycetota bacterium]|nr:Gfo/Idh/MocA family oxidoreductase [Planctomycetota bacterium]